ncbi:Protein of unknown function [Gryllus bimaculatus]|nr:Protein of unknown function [Gryllus bimaculatus]
MLNAAGENDGRKAGWRVRKAAGSEAAGVDPPPKAAGVTGASGLLPVSADSPDGFALEAHFCDGQNDSNGLSYTAMMYFEKLFKKIPVLVDFTKEIDTRIPSHGLTSLRSHRNFRTQHEYSSAVASPFDYGRRIIECRENAFIYDGIGDI